MPGQGRVQPSLSPGDRTRRAGGARRRAWRADAPARPLRPRRAPRLCRRVARRSSALGRRGADRPGHAPARSQPLAGGSAAAALGAAAHALLGDPGRGQRRADARRGLLAQRPLGAAARELDGVEEPVLAGALLPHRQDPGRWAGSLLRAPADTDLRHAPRARASGPAGDRLSRRRSLLGARVGELRRRDQGGRCEPAARRPARCALCVGADRGGVSRRPLRGHAQGGSRRGTRVSADLQAGEGTLQAGERTVASDVLRPPPGASSLPAFQAGWLQPGSERLPFLNYVADEHTVNWSEDLENLHEESSRTYFIDVWTRRAIIARLAPLPAAPTVIDLGCSTGYLLEDLRRAAAQTRLIGVDLVAGGLRKAHLNVPDALLLQADVCALPLKDASVDAVVSANLLEHVPADEQALAE